MFQSGFEAAIGKEAIDVLGDRVILVPSPRQLNPAITRESCSSMGSARRRSCGAKDYSLAGSLLMGSGEKKRA